MITKTNLLQEFDQARNHIRTLLVDINPQLEIYPKWTIKEQLAHLAGWDDATIQALQAHNRGEAPPLLAMRGINFYNAQTVGERAELTLPQIIREWEMVREQLLAILAELPEEKLSDPIVSPWGRTMTVADLVKIMVDHEEKHAEAIQEGVNNENR